MDARAHIAAAVAGTDTAVEQAVVRALGDRVSRAREGAAHDAVSAECLDHLVFWVDALWTHRTRSPFFTRPAAVLPDRPAYPVVTAYLLGAWPPTCVVLDAAVRDVVEAVWTAWAAAVVGDDAARQRMVTHTREQLPWRIALLEGARGVSREWMVDWFTHPIGRLQLERVLGAAR